MKRLMVSLSAALLVLFLGTTATSASVATSPHGVGTEFPYGVGAFDIGPRAATLWTQTSALKIDIEWTTDPSFESNVRSLLVPVPRASGIMLQPVGALMPGSRYYYRFSDPRTSAFSATGTFLTAPKASTDVGVTFDLSGDQDGTLNPATGLPCFNNFESFAAIQRDAPAFYVNLGDTIYSDSECKEAPGGIGKDVTLAQYRADHAQNLTYPNWTNLRSAVGMYSEWDDHEVRNDWDQTFSKTLIERGRRAFQEYEGVQKWSPKLGFYRTFTWGKNVQLFILDERSFRTVEADRMDVDNNGKEDCQNPQTHQPDLAPTLSAQYRAIIAAQFPDSGLFEPVSQQCLDDLNGHGRTMLGKAQQYRFLHDLAASTATWKLVITEDQISQYFALPYDRWEGYRNERQNILNFIDTNGIKNVEWLATDVHAYMGHTVDPNTDTPGSTGGVQGMFEYSFGPIATDTFAVEVNTLFGVPGCQTGCPADLVKQFLLGLNLNTCVAMDTYGYGRITVDPETHQLTIQPADQNGTPISTEDPTCHDFIALPS